MGSDAKPVIVRLRPNKFKFIELQSKKLGVPKATVIQLMITEKQREIENEEKKQSAKDD